ncbi:MAG: helix-turn-helix domain-containing protein [Phycisphaerales bacterium]
MATKAQHGKAYQQVPLLLKQLRENAGLTQRALGLRMGKPQSWIYNCETANRRVDVTEFIAWVRACECDPRKVFATLLRSA